MRAPIVIASKSAVRKQILEESGLKCEVINANIDEDSIKNSLLQKHLYKIVNELSS